MPAMNVSDTLVAMRTLAGETFVRTGASVIVLLAANSGVLFLFMAYDLNVAQLIIIYWWESLWVGLFCVAKLITASVAGDPYRNRLSEVSRGAALLTSVAAIGLTAGQFLGIFALLGFTIGAGLQNFSDASMGELIIRDAALLVGLSLMLFVGHAFSFLVNFLALGEYKTARASTLISLPFVRTLALLVTIVGACAVAAVVPQIASSWAFSGAAIALKVLLDYRLHLRERRSLNVL